MQNVEVPVSMEKTQHTMATNMVGADVNIAREVATDGRMPTEDEV